MDKFLAVGSTWDWITPCISFFGRVFLGRRGVWLPLETYRDWLSLFHTRGVRTYAHFLDDTGYYVDVERQDYLKAWRLLKSPPPWLRWR